MRSTLRTSATSVAVLVLAVLLCVFARDQIVFAAETPGVRRGEVKFGPVANESEVVPELFRLTAADFQFEQKPQPWQGDVAVSYVTFPSPVKTPHENNNTVHCEYYRPAKPGKYPACVVLHILGGDFPLSRMFAHHLARNGVAALFVKMPYYGERAQPGTKARMISVDPKQTVQGITQAVKDVRYATAWLAAQEEVDADQLGVFGISLGGIMATLSAEAEPRLSKCCSLLAGGDLARVLRDTNERRIVEARRLWTSKGKTIDELIDLMKTVDPCTYGKCLHGRKVLMLNAKNDEVIPPECTESLWEACGRPEIHWYNAGHFTAILYLADAMNKVEVFFGGNSKEQDAASTSASEASSKVEAKEKE